MAGSLTAGSQDGLGTVAGFYQLNALFLDSSGNIFVSDRSNHKIRMVSTSGASNCFSVADLC